MDKEIIDKLEDQLRADIESLRVPSNSAAARRALHRLHAVAEHSPHFIVLLAEPWIGSEVSHQTMAILVRCARVHLYARILDDALDENLPVHRTNLLRSQSMFWETVQGIGSSVSEDVHREAVRLIAETTDAVEIDDDQRTPLQWGAKNHHLLLAPLLLSGNSTAYQACRPGLSILIALVQAGDEWRQGEIAAPAVHREFMSLLTDSLDPGILSTLSQYGWHGAAERIVWNSRRLLESLSS